MATVDYKLCSFSTLPYQPEWQASVQQGLLTIVLRSDRTTVTAITMDVPMCAVKMYTHDEFRKAFIPNLWVSRRLAAQQLKTMRFMGAIEPNHVEALQEIINEEKDIRVPLDQSLYTYRSETGRYALAKLDEDGDVLVLTIEDGKVLDRYMTKDDFSSVYSISMGNYAHATSAKVFQSYAAAAGQRLSPAAKAFLTELTSKQTRSTTMANAAKKSEKKVSKPSAVESAEKRSTQAPTKSPAVAKAAKEKQAPRETASKMFRELIMDGKLNDDQIFQKVQAKFGLGDEKRNYVKWYRNHLKKTGHNPPEAKKAA